MIAVLALVALALAGSVAALAVYAHRTARTRDRAKLRDLNNADLERRVALQLLATIRDHASTADQAGLSLSPAEVVHLIDRFHTTRTQ